MVLPLHPTVERKVFFYRVDAGNDGAGVPHTFDAPGVFDEVDALGWDVLGRYHENSDSSVTACWPDRVEYPVRVRIGTVRRLGLPPVEDAGNLSPLNLTPTAGLAECTHMVFFEPNLVGCEFNFYAPRMSRLARYLQIKTPERPRVSFDVLLRSDVQQRLTKLKDIKFFQLRVRASYAETIGKLNADLGSAMEAAARAGDAEEIEIILRPKGRKGALRKMLLGFTKKANARSDFHENAANFIVKGTDLETHNTDTVDVLSGALWVKKTVAKLGPGRLVDSESAYAAIEAAHAAHVGEIEAATSVTIA